MAGRVFINYRRADSRPDAARLYDLLTAEFGKSAIFMDVDVLRPGQRFDKELERALSRCDVFLSLIGPRWLELLQERQASGALDLVQVEIAEALKRNILVVPVLIDGAPMPRADALPDAIRPLVLHHGHSLTYSGFNRDTHALINTIRDDGFQLDKPSRVWAIITWTCAVFLAFTFSTMPPSLSAEIVLLCLAILVLGTFTGWSYWTGWKPPWRRKRRNETALPETPNP